MIAKPVIYIALAVITALFFTSGCVDLTRTYPDKSYYSLNTVRVGDENQPSGDVILQIQRFQVSSNYGGKHLVYRRNQVGYEPDYYHEFLTFPDGMITDQIRRWLSKSAVFESVISSTSRIDPTHILEGNITALYGDYQDRSASKAVVEIQIFLIEEAAVDTSIIFQKNYRADTLLSSQKPEKLIAGFNVALEKILQTLEQDLQQALLP